MWKYVDSVQPQTPLRERERQAAQVFQVADLGYAEYFTGREWENDNTIEPKYIRYLQTSKHVFFFYRPGKDVIPKDYKELKRIAKAFAEQPDPLPYRDDDGNIVQLTDEEKERWENNKTRKQGRRMATPAATNNTTTSVPDIKDEDLPF